MVRDATRLEGRSWSSSVDVVEGDVTDPASLDAALAGVDVAFYLVHSMTASGDFRRRDRLAAQLFAAACARAEVQRIVYLGGLGDPGGDLSEHLRSRQETGVALRSAGVPVIEFRAAIVVGAGSISFEMIRYLTERLPVMVCPRWVYTRVQPIAVRDVLAYLSAATTTPARIEPARARTPRTRAGDRRSNLRVTVGTVFIPNSHLCVRDTEIDRPGTIQSDNSIRSGTVQ